MMSMGLCIHLASHSASRDLRWYIIYVLFHHLPVVLDGSARQEHDRSPGLCTEYQDPVAWDLARCS